MDGIQNLLKDSLARSLYSLCEQDRLEMAWRLACGPALAARGAVVGYNDGIVTIEVGELPWLEEMRRISDHLKADLARIAGVKLAKLQLIVKR